MLCRVHDDQSRYNERPINLSKNELRRIHHFHRTVVSRSLPSGELTTQQSVKVSD